MKFWDGMTDKLLIKLTDYLMISDDEADEPVRVSIEKLFQYFDSIGSFADGGVLESISEMDDAAQGKFYGVQLPEAHDELDIDHFGLICIRGGADEQLVQLAIGWDDTMKIYLRGGEANNYGEFTEIKGFDLNLIKQALGPSTTDLISQKVISDEFYKKTIFNVTTEVPLSAGSYYTSATSQTAVPTAYRKIGLVITYEVSAGIWESQRFIGTSVSSWTTGANWKKYESAANIILTTAASVSTIRSRILTGDRIQGLIITYVFNSEVITEQYLSTDYSAGAWTTESNWLRLGSYGNTVLTYTTDAGTTRKLIQQKYRKRGTTITYFNGTALITERYNFTTLTDSYWANDIYWERLTTSTDVDAITSYLAGAYYTQIGYAVLRNSGVVDSQSSYSCTDKLPVDRYSDIIFEGADYSSFAGLCFYDSSDKPILPAPSFGLTGTATYTFAKENIPATAVYFRCTKANTQTAATVRKGVNSISVFRNISDKISREVATINTFYNRKLRYAKGIFAENGIAITGASFVNLAENGWFEYACTKLGVTAYNFSVAGSNIMDTALKMQAGTLFTKAQFEAFDAFCIFHAHNNNVFDLPDFLYNGVTYTAAILNGYNAAAYEASGILNSFIGLETGYQTDPYYAIAYDYVIKKYKDICYAARLDSTSKYYNYPANGYGENSPYKYGKPCQIVLMTNWNDGRLTYNNTIRSLAIKFDLPLIAIDEMIFAGTGVYSPDGLHPSRMYSRDNEDTEASTPYLPYGKHMIYTKIAGELPYIQKKIAKIFQDCF